MSNFDKVMDVMRSDPERKWTAREIANLVAPDGSPKSFHNNRIFKILVIAERYGMVRRVTDNRPRLWVLT